MKKQLKYSPEVIERAVRMVSEAGSQYESQWAAINVDRGQDRLHAGDAAPLGTPAGA